MDMKKLKKGNYIVHQNEPCIIKNIQFLPNKNNPVVKLELEGLFTDKSYDTQLTNKTIQEADLTRKCATIVSKKKNKIQIMDVTTFETFYAIISKELLAKAQEGDNITYIQFGNTAKVLEVRK